ncbi:elongation factor P hydroxylase [Aliikangiella maris]|uniref:Elongation factor P hydroxylase n=2 Tax=Aliikangiella maris TaxID=3162458 RepID=A0ABV2BVU2_9GAMM
MLSEKEKLKKLVLVFNELFSESENTELVIGAKEPFYQAARNNQKAMIFSREDYFSSALHEIAHWCIAGKKRRELDDFGYWYEPEGRTLTQQQVFEQVEVKPQALEWLFSIACGHQFYFSADNLSQSIDASQSFKNAVTQQLNHYLSEKSLPARARLLANSLAQAFNQQLFN